MAEAKKPLPVQQISSVKSVLTHFWWDNFDCNKENIQGSVHTTHGVAFQEVSSNTMLNDVDEEITPSGRKSLKVIGCALPPVSINPKKPPKCFEKENIDGTVINNEWFSEILTLWKLSRRIFGGDKQLIPRFIGWIKAGCKDNSYIFTPYQSTHHWIQHRLRNNSSLDSTITVLKHVVHS